MFHAFSGGTSQLASPCPAPLSPKPGRGPLEGVQAAVAGKSPPVCFLIWKMEAVTFARGDVTRTKEKK